MAKKLTIEVDADVAKAKAKMKKAVAEASAEGGASPSPAAPSSSADALSKSLKNASKNLDELGAKSHASASQIAGVVRSFAGLGVGMAMNYAAHSMERGPARTAIEAGGSGLSAMSATSGALMATPMPPQIKLALAALAGAAGVAKSYYDDYQEKKKYNKDFEKSEDDFAKNYAWQEKFRSLTNVERIDPKLKGDDALKAESAAIAKTIEELRKNIAMLKDAEANSLNAAKAAAKDGRLDEADRERAQLATDRNKRIALEDAARSLEKRREGVEDRLATPKELARDLSLDYATAGDALSKVGGAFAGGGGPVEMTDKVMGRKADRQIQLLEKIANKNGGATWQ